MKNPSCLRLETNVIRRLPAVYDCQEPPLVVEWCGKEPNNDIHSVLDPQDAYFFKIKFSFLILRSRLTINKISRCFLLDVRIQSLLGGIRSRTQSSPECTNIILLARISWNCLQWLQWHQVEKTIAAMADRLSPRHLLIFHEGSKDLSSNDKTSKSFFHEPQCSLYRYHALWPNTRLV